MQSFPKTVGIPFFFLLLSACTTLQRLPQAPSLIEAVRQWDNTTIYQEFLQQAGGLALVLEEAGKYSLLVPTDDAFETFGTETLLRADQRDSLRKLLRNHALPDPVNPDRLAKRSYINTLEEEYYSVETTSGLYLGDALVLKVTQTKEGYVYLIDTVLKFNP